MTAPDVAGLNLSAPNNQGTGNGSASHVSTVLHIEDDRLWTEYVAGLLRELPDFQSLGASANGCEGIARCREKQPDVVILDLGLPDMNGFAVMNQLIALPCPPRILLLTALMEEALLNRVVLGGITGLVWKGGDFSTHLHPALQAVAGGRTYFPAEVREAVRQFRSAPEAFFKMLTPLEQELVSLLAQGFRDEAIAIKIQRSRGTIRNHWHNIAKKVNVRTRDDLKHWAEAKGFRTSIRAVRSEISDLTNRQV